jgi:hypothetical protein
MVGWQMMNWRGSGRKQSWPKQDTNMAFDWNDRGKSWKTCVRTASVPAEIRTEHLSDTSLEHCLYTKLFTSVVKKLLSSHGFLYHIHMSLPLDLILSQLNLIQHTEICTIICLTNWTHHSKWPYTILAFASIKWENSVIARLYSNSNQQSPGYMYVCMCKGWA